jgi:tetratricopeptide (TPR) repeat protein
MAVPHNFYTGFKCKTTFMAAGTGLLMGFFASIFVPPWFHPLIQLLPVPLGGLAAVIANLWTVRSYIKGEKRGLFEYVYRELHLDPILKSKIANAWPGAFSAVVELESLALYKALMAQAEKLHDDERFLCYMAAARVATIGSEDRNAIEALKQALSIRPNDIIANFRLARSFERIGTATEAIKAYLAALLDPTIDAEELRAFIADQAERVREKGPDQRSPIPGLIYQLM